MGNGVTGAEAIQSKEKNATDRRTNRQREWQRQRRRERASERRRKRKDDGDGSSGRWVVVVVVRTTRVAVNSCGSLIHQLARDGRADRQMHKDTETHAQGHRGRTTYGKTRI